MSRMITFAGIINARDLGGLTTMDGKTIRKGLLLRTANLSQATEADLSRLRQDYRLSAVIDLRTLHVLDTLFTHEDRLVNMPEEGMTVAEETLPPISCAMAFEPTGSPVSIYSSTTAVSIFSFLSSIISPAPLS